MEDGDRTTAGLDGELDMSTADSVRSAASAALAQRPGVLVVDLRLVRFIDSSGLRALVAFSVRPSASTSGSSSCAVPGK